LIEGVDILNVGTLKEKDGRVRELGGKINHALTQMSDGEMLNVEEPSLVPSVDELGRLDRRELLL